MNRFKKTYLQWTGAVALILTCLSVSSAAPLSCSFSIGTKHPTVGEPIFVEFSIQNARPNTVTLTIGSNSNGYGSFRAKLTRPDGKTEAGPKPRANDIVSRETLAIGPYQSATIAILLNKWFDFTTPGCYSVELDFTPLDGEGFTSRSASGSLSVEISPRDPVKLFGICAELSDQVVSAKTTTQAIDAAVALSHVRDPVAIPFLDHLLAVNRSVIPDVVAGLEAIGDINAVYALVDHRNDRQEDVKDLVRAALSRIARKTADPQIRLAIESAQ